MEETKKIRRERKPSVKKTADRSDAFKKLKLLVTVVNRSKTEFFMDLLTAFEVNFQVSLLG